MIMQRDTLRRECAASLPVVAPGMVPFTRQVSAMHMVILIACVLDPDRSTLDVDRDGRASLRL
jgi:hypothetical protein